MDAISPSVVGAASAADPGTVQGVAAISVLKKALDMQAASAAKLLEALPAPALAATGSIGTRINTFA